MLIMVSFSSNEFFMEPNNIFYLNYNQLKQTLGGRTLFRWPSRSALPNGAFCSDDLAQEHYRLRHAVSMAGLWPTTERNHISYWNYNLIEAHSGWSHAVWWPSRSSLPNDARSSDDLSAVHYWMVFLRLGRVASFLRATLTKFRKTHSLPKL